MRGEAATHLPWLCPCAASLTALARAPNDAWEVVRFDPALVLLMARLPAATQSASFPSLVHDPLLIDSVLSHLERDASLDQAGNLVDWSEPALRPVISASWVGARLAAQIAEATGICPADTAWVAALLAPLGWFAVCAVNPQRAVDCLSDPAHARHAAATEQRHWGLDAAALGRRLVQRWRLPAWLGAVIGHLGLPAEMVAPLGGNLEVFRIVQAAFALVQQQGLSGLQLPVRPATADAIAAVGLTRDQADALLRAVASEEMPTLAWEHPGRLPLLRDLLTVAAENRRLKDIPALADLQHQLDELHQALETQLASEGERLRAQKLGALAEFAAGAGHEINNPLAVISGQAQYLLKKIADCRMQNADCGLQSGLSDAQSAFCNLQSAMEPALNTVIQQTKRIHQILTELMQFARPPRPQKETVDIAGLVREVAAELHESAARGQVELVFPEPGLPVCLDADPNQLRTALTCLLRNALESAPAGGWASIRVDAADAEYVELIVEDNGSGPAPGQREHLFDPFYSGKHAGRGRGLGLPTAWRLAREHGGDVRFEGRAGCPTRFVMSLPRANGNGLPNVVCSETSNGVSA